MAELNIEKMQHKQLPYTFPNLGKKKRLKNNAPPTIYTSARKVLKDIFGDNVVVTCSATYNSSKAQAHVLIL